LHFCFVLFSEVFHILSCFLFNIVYFHPEFIYLFIYCVLCFTLVFIQYFYSLFVLVLSQILYFCCLGIS
jgi:hypothetical protein